METYKLDNINKLKNDIYSKDNLKLLIAKLEKTSNKQLTKTEIYNFINFTKEFNFTKLYNTHKNNLNNINEEFINYYLVQIGKLKSDFDIHEFFKKEINGKASVKGTTDYNFSHLVNKKSSEKKPDTEIIKQSSVIPQIQSQTNIAPLSNLSNLPNLVTKQDQIEFAKILNYQSLWRDSNILVDSRYQNIANSDRSKIVFSIESNTKIKNPGSGVITTISNMRDVVEMEIFPFSIPYIAAADNYYKKITLSILELSSISIEAYEDSQFHFIFQTNVNGNLIDLIPINKIFRFYKPITRINEFSLRFGSPLNPITFDKDRLTTSSISYISNPGSLTFSESHNLITGDLIYIDEFTTNSPAIDLNIINEINNHQGHICTRINNTTITINVDFTQITNPIATLSVLVYFGSKRIMAPIKFRYLIGKED
jgi:hypothetical protein